MEEHLEGMQTEQESLRECLERLTEGLDFLKPKSPKVIKLYEAVAALLGRGADLSNLKVAEIAKEAGIGKGTTYDYFNSREELIVKAVIYDVYGDFYTLCCLIDEQKEFKGKILLILDQMFERMTGGNGMFRFMVSLYSGVESVPRKFKEELSKCNMPAAKMYQLINHLYDCAVREKLVHENLPSYYIHTAFMNLLLNYGAYQLPMKGCTEHSEEGFMNHGDIPDREAIKERLYENLLYMLR